MKKPKNPSTPSDGQQLNSKTIMTCRIYRRHLNNFCFPFIGLSLYDGIQLISVAAMVVFFQLIIDDIFLSGNPF